MAVGKRIRGGIYLHRSALDVLPVADRKRVETAARATGALWNVVRVAPREVSLLQYGDFEEEPFPVLLSSTLVQDCGRTVCRDYAQRINPPILHRKEMLVGEEYPQRSSWASVTTMLEEAGAFADPHRIGTREAWRQRLIGLAIDETGKPTT